MRVRVRVRVWVMVRVRVGVRVRVRVTRDEAAPRVEQHRAELEPLVLLQLHALHRLRQQLALHAREARLAEIRLSGQGQVWD